MTPREIEAADFIIRLAGFSGMTAELIAQQSGKNILEVKKAAAHLKMEKLIEVDKQDFMTETYSLTATGIDFQESRKKYIEYLEEKAEKLRVQSEKEGRDEYHKSLQIKDLETKLNVMNTKQLDFWKAQKQKNVQTTIIAIIGAFFSIIAFLKSYGIL
jgi:hypothetical protein